MNECMVNELGEMLEILQEDREPIEGEFKVTLIGYYEVLNEQRYDNAIYDFKINAWLGVGNPRPLPTPSTLLTPEERIKLLEEAFNSIMEGSTING